MTAASRGIGAACARQLAADGYQVALMARIEQVLPVTEEVGGFVVRGDLTRPPNLARLIDTVAERWGRLDVLVNSAGDPPRGDPRRIRSGVSSPSVRVALLPGRCPLD